MGFFLCAEFRCILHLTIKHFLMDFPVCEMNFERKQKRQFWNKLFMTESWNETNGIKIESFMESNFFYEIANFGCQSFGNPAAAAI